MDGERMTIGIAEAQKRNRAMSSNCSGRKHPQCSGYRIVSWTGGFRNLGFCKCECHSTQNPLDPPRNAAKPHPHLNRGVTGEGDE